VGFLKGLHGLGVLLHGLLSSQQEQVIMLVTWGGCLRVVCHVCSVVWRLHAPLVLLHGLLSSQQEQVTWPG
jgi:hypothetical protein